MPLLVFLAGCDVVPVQPQPEELTISSRVGDRNAKELNAKAPREVGVEPVGTEKPGEVLHREVFRSDEGPTTVFLHGYGSNEDDMAGLARRAGLSGEWLGYRAPITLRKGRYAWFHVDFSSTERRYSDEEVHAAAARVIAALEHEKTPVTLAGFSQGGMLSLYVGLKRPDLVSRVIVFSGPGPLPEDVKSSHLPVFMSHGTADQVIDIGRARVVAERLSKMGVDLEYVEIEGLAHAVSPEVLQRLGTWVSSL